MKKLLLLTKTLLVAVLLGVGASNAWGAVETETVYSQNFEGLAAVPSDWTQESGTISLRTVSENTYLNEMSAGSGSRGAWMTGTTIQDDLDDINATNYTVEFDAIIYEGNNTGNYSQGVYVLGTTLTQSWGQPSMPIAKVQKGSNASAYTIAIGGVDKKTDVALTSGTWYHYIFVMSNKNATTSNFTVTIKNQAKTATIATVTGDVDCDSYGLVSGVAIQAGRNSNKVYSVTSGSTGIDNILVTADIDKAAVFVDYQVEYRYGGSLIKSTTANGQVGTTAVLTSDYKTPFWASETKYYYVSDDASSTTIESASTVVTVTCRLAANYGYTVKAVDGSSKILATLATGTSVEGEQVAVNYPKYVNNNGTLYTKDATNKQYTYYYTPSGDGLTENVTYAVTDITNTVFYVEGEDIEDATIVNSGGTYSRTSKCATGKLSATEITTLPKGAYRITMAFYNSNSGSYSASISDGTNTLFTHSFPQQWATYTSEEDIVLTESTTLYGTGGDDRLNNYKGIDYIYIQKVGEVATISADGLGYATFSCTYPLDFTTVTEATAYIATAQNGDNITMKPITGKVAANTGLVLKSANGGAASFNIPIADSGSYYDTGTNPVNYLFDIDSDYNLNAPTSGGTNYVLSVQSNNVVWAPIGETAAPVTAGHAALWIPGTNSRSLRMVFGDNSVTGIGDAMRLDDKGQMVNDKVVFNLNGQRVKKAAKGLYIVNGKKYVK